MSDTVPPRDLCAYRWVVTSHRPQGAPAEPCHDHLADPPARRRGTARPFHRPPTT